MIILFNVKNDAYRRIFGVQACSRAEISFYEILKHQSGQTTLQNHFFQKFFQRSISRSESHTPCNFHGRINVYSRVIDKILFQTICDSRVDDFRFGDKWVYFESKFYCELSTIKIFWIRPRKFFQSRFSLKCVGKNIFLDFKFEISVKFRVE